MAHRLPVLLLFATLTLGACASPVKAPLTLADSCEHCGVIQSINARSIDARPPAGGESRTAYELRVRMDDGGLRNVTVASAEGLREGDRVEIESRRVTLL